MKHLNILATASALVLFLSVSLLAADGQNPAHPDFYTWKPIRIGAGGWLVGMDMAPDGTKVVRADTYGAYLWNATAGEWKQLITSDSMPAELVKPAFGNGVYEIRIAPSDTKRFFMFYFGDIYRTDDRGSHWKQTSFPHTVVNANDVFRTSGQKMAIDPANPDVVYAGTPNSGVFVTTDGGAKWQAVGAVPVSAKVTAGPSWRTEQLSPGNTGIAFDASSGVINGRTKVIYIPSCGSGIWRSADAGATWTQIFEGGVTGRVVQVSHGAVSSTGDYFVTDEHAKGTDQRGVWKYSKGVWEGIYPAGKGIHSLALDSGDPQNIVIGDQGGCVDQSFDGGKTWTGQYRTYTNVATDIPYLGWTPDRFKSNGAMQIDPITHELYFSEGIGVWKATLPHTVSPFEWISESKGIEQLCSLVVTAPPGGKPVVGGMDRPLFYVDDPDVYPSTHGPNKEHAIIHGYSIDYASSDPKFLAAIVDFDGKQKDEETCYSTDGGKTWTKFASYPDWTIWPVSGCIAASTPENIIWGASNKHVPYYTKDGGKTWASINIPGTDDAGWGWAHWFNRQQVAADRVNIGTFYMYNYVSGLYRSTDGGDNWTLVYKGPLTPWSNLHAKLKTTPGQAGHLFFTAGQQGKASDPHPVKSVAFVHSTDGGVTWAAAPDVFEVRCFGFGAQAPGAKYPTIYIAGWVKDEWGIWESNDEAKTWKKIGDYPTGSLSGITCIDGDKTTYGKVYLGLNGDGWAYGVAPGGATSLRSDSPATP